jgi:hypothetical protein
VAPAARGTGLRLLEIGRGTAEDAGLWLHKGVPEYVGVDLDEEPSSTPAADGRT